MEQKHLEILRKAVEKYGKNAQVMQAIEEMSELNVELCEYNKEAQNPLITETTKSMSKLTKVLIKNINRNANNIKEIIEEIADVQIMIYQLIMIFSKEDKDLNEKLLGGMEYKIQRLKERMGE